MVAALQFKGTLFYGDRPDDIEPVRRVGTNKAALTRAVMEDSCMCGEMKLLTRLCQEAAWDLLGQSCLDEEYSAAFYFFTLADSHFWGLMQAAGVEEDGAIGIAQRAIDGMNGRLIVPYEEVVKWSEEEAERERAAEERRKKKRRQKKLAKMQLRLF